MADDAQVGPANPPPRIALNLCLKIADHGLYNSMSTPLIALMLAHLRPILSSARP